MKLPAGQITDFGSRPESVKRKMIGAPDLFEIEKGLSDHVA